MTTEVIEIEEEVPDSSPLLGSSQSTELGTDGGSTRLLKNQPLHGSMMDLRMEANPVLSALRSSGLTLTLPTRKTYVSRSPASPVQNVKPSLTYTPDTPQTPRGDLHSELTDITEEHSQYYDPETEFDEITERYIGGGEAEERDALLEDQEEFAEELMFEQKEDIHSQQKRLAQEFLKDEYHFEQELAHLKEHMRWRKKKKKKRKLVYTCLSRIRDSLLNYNKYWNDMFLSLLLYCQTLALLWVLPLRYPKLLLKYSWWIKIFNLDFISWRPEIDKYMSYPFSEWIGYDYIWFPPFMGLSLFLPLLCLFAWFFSSRCGFCICEYFLCSEKLCSFCCNICCNCSQRLTTCCCTTHCRFCEGRDGRRIGHRIGHFLAGLFDNQWKYVIERIMFHICLLIYTPVLICLLLHGFCLTDGNTLAHCKMVCEDEEKFWCLFQSMPALLIGVVYAILQPILIGKELWRLNVHKINRKHLQYLRNMEVEKGLGISNDYVVQRLHLSSSFSRRGGYYFYIGKYHLRPLILIIAAMTFPKMSIEQELGTTESNWEIIFAVFTFVLFLCSPILEICIRPYRISTRFIVEIVFGISICITILCCWMKSLDLQNALLVDNSLFMMLLIINVVALCLVMFLFVIFLCAGCTLGMGVSQGDQEQGVGGSGLGKWPINSTVVNNLRKKFAHYLKAVEDGKLLYQHAITTTPSFVRCDLLNHQKRKLQKMHKESILMDNPLSATLENVILQLESEYYANESMSLMPQKKLQEKIGELRGSLDKRMEEMVLIPQRNRILFFKILAYNAFRKMAGRRSLVDDDEIVGDGGEMREVEMEENKLGNLYDIVITQDEQDVVVEKEVDEEEEEGEEVGELDLSEDGISLDSGDEDEDTDESGEGEGSSVEESLEETDDGLINFDPVEKQEENSVLLMVPEG